jgi:N-acyl-phosphatidylethanolamine-hydrolysing phospholipase D
MNRRKFLRVFLTTLKSYFMMSLIPRPLRAAAADGSNPLLHYTPLNGRSLRGIARSKLHHGDNRFINPLGPGRQNKFWKVLSWKLFHENKFKSYLDDEQVIPLEINWERVRQGSDLSVTFLKHASLMIKDGDRYILIDPVFSNIFWFIKDFTPLSGGLGRMPQPDHVLITHGHYDHLDKPSLASLDKGTHIVTPLGYDNIFRDLSMTNRTRLDWYGAYRSGSCEIILLPCNHWTMRNPLIGPNQSLWGSYLVRTSGGYTIFISGDTAYFDGFQELGEQFDIDLAIFNLGAYEPRWFMAKSHINPSETVRAFRELRARKLMVVHWGTFRLGDEPVHFPPMHIRQEMEKAGQLDRLIDLKHGQTADLS